MAADRVIRSVGYTVNMGDFESMRFEVGIETDVRDDEKAPQAMERAKRLIHAQLAEDIKEANAHRNR